MKKINNITVIKIGGKLLDSKIFPRLAKALSPWLRKYQTVIVHGGGKEISDWSRHLGIASRFVQGRRFTDKKTMELVEMVLSGKVNPYLVSQLASLGIAAIGLSGRSAGTVQASRIQSLGYVGIPKRVRSEVIYRILSLGFVPVFASLASDSDSGALNVNADEMASALAVSLKARRLILCTDVPGILDCSGKTIPQISAVEGRALIENKVVTGGMIPKINSAVDALQRGVKEIWVLEGRLPLNQAKGTLLTANGRRSPHPFYVRF